MRPMPAALVTAALLLPLLTFTHAAPATPTSCPAVQKCLSADNCTILPVPNASLSRLVPPSPEGFTITNIRSGVYSFKADSYLSLILFKNGRLTLVDFPLTADLFRDAQYLLTVATARILNGVRPRRLDMVYGHRHFDHIGGAPYFLAWTKDRFPHIPVFVWATEETEQFLARNPNSNIPKPNVRVWPRGRTVNLAPSLNVKLIILGGHVRSDLVAHVLPSRDGPGIAHLVDFVRPGFVPFIEFGFTIDLGRYISAQAELLKLNFDTFSPGHLRLGSKKDVMVNMEYAQGVIKAAAEAFQEITGEELAKLGLGRVADPSAVEFGNSAWVTNQILGLGERICLRKLIDRYGCSLGAVVQFGPSQCRTAFAYLQSEVEPPFPAR